MSGAQRTASVLGEVQAERARQDRKWGEQNHDDFKWMTILGEEYGETCRGLLEGDDAQARKEALEVAAVAVAFVEAIDRKHQDGADGVTGGSAGVKALPSERQHSGAQPNGPGSTPGLPRPFDPKKSAVVAGLERGETVTFIGMDPPGPVRPLISHVHEWQYGVPELEGGGALVPVRCYCKEVRRISIEQALEEIIRRNGEMLLAAEDRRKERRFQVGQSGGPEEAREHAEELYSRPFGGATP